MFLAAGCSGPLPNTVPLPPARSSPPVSHHLLHLPEIQSGMENPHPQPIYTSCLTSPRPSGTYGRGRALPCTPLYLGGVLVPEVPVLLDPSIRLAMTCGQWPPSRANNSVF